VFRSPRSRPCRTSRRWSDFIRLRGTPGIGNHILQSAGDALKKGEPEETVLGVASCTTSCST